MIRIVAPHFCAGTGAPILRYMRGWSEERILDYCRAKGWEAERMSDDYQKYDSDSTMSVWAVRLAKDADVVKTKNGDMTKLTFVHTSSGEDDEDMWMEAIINDAQAERAAKLVKGDVLPGIEGFLVSKRSEQDPEKIFYTLKRARIHFGVALLTELKERGEKKTKGTKAAKPAAKKTAAKPAAKTEKARPIIEDDEDEAEGDEE